ncbi:MAG TPA: DEAD/DEAH box helicase [Pseudomonadales bacterium]
MTDVNDQPDFLSLGLSAPVLKALKDVGYESPSPIQAACIPYLLAGHDLLGQAQTGTGKTAAFALPVLSNIDLSVKDPQVLVLAPTRELAIQVAEAFQTYARYIKNFHVLPIYGGQGYDTQLRQLRRGVHVVVGTPGRVMDHMRKGTLKLDSLTTLVLDEADEMLRMGFIDDVEWVLQHSPSDRQIALFSATMPAVIKKVANKHLNQPKEVKIASKTATASTVRQRYWEVSGLHKLDALTRILEMESFDAMLIFVRTKAATEELASKLSARGYASEALNGDIAQNTRERIVERLKKGQLDILIATDVVARGLDVERISHVVNYDIPYDTESYVHRIGRTGRAGRSGEAILFVAHREQRMLRAIEQATRQPIEHMKLPSTSDINQQRIVRFKQRISDTLASDDLALFLQLVAEYQQEHDADPIQIAAALARLAQGDQPLFLSEKDQK